MAARSAPTVEFDGRTYVLVEHDPENLVRTGPVILVSRREVEADVANMERRIAHNAVPDAKKRYAAKLKAYRQLLGKAGGGAEEGEGEG